MFITNWQPILIENSQSVTMTCPNCGNHAKHQVYKQAYGLAIAIPFMSQPLISNYNYFLLCSICNNPTKKISKEEMQSLLK